PEILRLSDRVRLIEAPDLSARFPAERYARVRFRMNDGRVFESETMPARGDAERPLSDDEIQSKFHALADGPLGRAAADELHAAITALPEQRDTRHLLDILLSAPDNAARSVAATA